MSPRRNITWIELLVVVSLLALVVAFLIPTIDRTRSRGIIVNCAGNLRQIGQALLLYTNDNRGRYPRTRTSAAPVRVPTWGTGAPATQPFTDANAPAANDVTAAFFLLLRTQDITANAFVCPASTAQPDTFAGLSPAARSNFTDIKKNLSYSYQNPYANDLTVKKDYRRLGAIDAEYAIAADMNPGTSGSVPSLTATSSAKELRPANSANHDRDGQNVLYHDGHVTWQASKFVGSGQDNIYATLDGKIIASPQEFPGASVYRNDSILLPTDD